MGQFLNGLAQFAFVAVGALLLIYQLPQLTAAQFGGVKGVAVYHYCFFHLSFHSAGNLAAE